ARHLGCPVGTILSRLAWARQRLRDRLTRRGVTVSVGLLITALAQNAVAATVPAPLVDTTLKAATTLAAGHAAAAGIISANAVARPQGMVRTMFLTKRKIAAAVFLGLGALGTGASAVAYRAWTGQPAEPANHEATRPAAEGKDKDRGEVVRVPSSRDG